MDSGLLVKDRSKYLDCRKVVEEIVEHFRDGYCREGAGFFDRSHEILRDSLENKYFEPYREGRDFDNKLVPLTTDFISYALSEILPSALGSERPNWKIVDVILDRLRERKEYGYLFLENGNERIESGNEQAA